MTGLALAWIAEAGLMTWRIVHQGRPAEAGGGRVPWPADYVATFVVFGGLSLAAELGPGWDRVAATAGWGLVLATVLNLVDPAQPFQRQQDYAKPGGGTQLRAAQPPLGVAPPNPLARNLGGA